MAALLSSTIQTQVSLVDEGREWAALHPKDYLTSTGQDIESLIPKIQITSTRAQLDDFDIIKLVGKGGFAKVYQVFALKAMRKDHVRKMKQVTNVINEKNIQKIASTNAFVVRIFETFQDHIHIFLVQEYLQGGDLYNYIKSHGNLKEAEAKFYAAELFLGLSFLHSLNIVYRDLKPENILFGYDGHIRIADLGFAKQLNGGGTTNSFCGTPSYLAPEILQRVPYGLAVDWWTFGVLLFQLCAGCSPFQESHPTKTFSRILNCAIRWPPEPQQYFTREVYDLIMRLFEIDPADRLSQAEIREHEWFGSICFSDLEERRIPPPQSIVDRIMQSNSSKTDLFEGFEQPHRHRLKFELSGGEQRKSAEQLFSDF